MSRDIEQGHVVPVEIEHEGETSYYALRHMDREMKTFQTFAPAKNEYNTFAVAMKIFVEFHPEGQKAANFEGAVGADNIMQALECDRMSEFISGAEERALQKVQQPD